MSNSLFEETLRQTSPLTAMTTKPMLCEEEEEEEDDLVTNILSAFSQTLTEDEIDDLDLDLEDYFEQWCEATGELSEDDTELLKQVLTTTAREAFGEGNDEDIRGVLKILATSPSSLRKNLEIGALAVFLPRVLGRSGCCEQTLT
jgi:hypothetical protein